MEQYIDEYFTRGESSFIIVSYIFQNAIEVVRSVTRYEDNSIPYNVKVTPAKMKSTKVFFAEYL